MNVLDAEIGQNYGPYELKFEDKNENKPISESEDENKKNVEKTEEVEEA